MGPSAPTQRYLAVLDWAAWHHGVVSRPELAAIGVPPTSIASWLRSGRLQRLHPGVFAVGHDALRTEGRWRGALLACGEEPGRDDRPRPALSHQTAMLAHGHRAPEHHGIHVTTQREARDRGELHLHRSPLAPGDIIVLGGLRVTSLARTLIDLADVLTWAEIVGVADRLWDIDLDALRAARGRAGRRTGRGRSKQLLEREEPHTRSEFERAFLRFVRRHGLPRPTGVNQRIGRFVVDAVYDEVLLAIELDGRAYHARRREMVADRHRDADLQGLGFRVLRLVWEDLYDEQAPATIARLTRLLRQRGA